MPRALADEATIQWYPGHMARAMRRLTEDMHAIDVVIEVADARTPYSGTNPALARLAGKRPRILVLTREHLADARLTAAWLASYNAGGRTALAIDAKDRLGVVRLRAALERIASETNRRGARAIVLGIPNAGKSTAINAIAGRNVARAEDRAGVTRSRQWFRVGDALEIMDTAGILVPKIDTPDAQWKLAFVGAVPRSRFDAEDVVARFHRWLVSQDEHTGVPDLETFAQSRGFVRRGTMLDTHNAAWSYIKDWSDGKFGRMTLEAPPT
ncbi:MAG: ribosome biogenesis GTPase YlqF [Candidatus Eremiobacteraeota bacterium]|nr:ribosome biogenesis GTPase YlqF [Candidatus Eremiobacteraeota bacterium]